MLHRAGRSAAATVTAFVVALASAPAMAEDAACAVPPGGLPIVAPLERSAARIVQGEPLTIVAMGSSSTSGVGASRPDLTYPSRLESDLRQVFPNLDIHVVNRGKGGEDAPEELARLGRDVIEAHPDLAVWQVGTNAVLRRDNLVADGEWLREGVDLLQRSGIDVVLMDLQYAPRVLERSAYPAMEEMIAAAADHAHVGLYRRFALMRYWQRSHASDAAPMVGPDGLHMTDTGYGCLAEDLAAALESNWRAEAKLAQRARGREAPAGEFRWLPLAASHSIQPPSDMRRNDATPFN